MTDPKKTERIEIRVADETKRAFTDACDRQGDTPSNAIRRFIDGYIRRAGNDQIVEGLRAIWRAIWRRRLPIATVTVAAAVLFSTFIFAQPKANEVTLDEGPAVEADLFAEYDRNADGKLSPGEISENDAPFQVALDVDGSGDVTLDEFWSVGLVQVVWAPEGHLTFTSDPHSPFTFESTSRSEFVRFDLRLVSAPSFDSTAFGSEPTRRLEKKTETTLAEPDRFIVFEGDKPIPSVVFSNHDFRARTV